MELGAFELHTKIAEGGMAEIWRGVHTIQGTPVAIKVITRDNATDATFLSAFRNEVHAVAGLSHPNIIMMFDHGTVDAQASRASGGHLRPGSPYLVMELSSHGALEQAQAPLPWSSLRSILLVLLDALAHAHARGVIHRDLKPGNVLISGEYDTRPGLKLTDFGIAHADRSVSMRSGDVEMSVGTPYYMAPEQIEGRWRTYGPWTDLYALGCMAYELATGLRPFEADNLVGLAFLHMSAPVPALPRPGALPKGFQAWLHRMMAKDPQARFRCAADAAWALSQLDESAPPQAPDAPRHPSHELLQAIPEAETGLRDTRVSMPQLSPQTLARLARLEPGQEAHGVTLPTFAREVDAPDTSSGLDVHRIGLPPLPLTWRRQDDLRRSMRLIGAGLSLYGLRAVPLIGRERERDVLWSALHDVRERGAARLVMLHGAAGNGKSRLVEWITQRAEEVGSAIVLQALHSPTPSPADGLSRMLARHFRCVGLRRNAMLDHLEANLRAQGVEDPYAWSGLAELIHPARADQPPPARPGAARVQVRFASPDARYALIVQHLRRLAQERPVIVWLDDVQWGFDALAFAQHLMRALAESPAPVLVLMTVRDEALAVQPVTQSKVREVMQLKGANPLRINPLDDATQRKLVEGLLGFEGGVASELARRTAGNPLFAVQIVDDWVQRGVLEVGERGFVVRPGVEATIPDTLYEVWNARIDRLVQWQSESALKALELAAVLGQEVSAREWRLVCAEAGVVLPPNLYTALQAQRLAIPRDNGWMFAHSILRETLERRARESQRWSVHHRACADMLRAEYLPGHRGVAERMGLHYVEAEALRDALRPLLDGARERRERSDLREALSLLSARDRALATLQIDPSDPRWGEGWVLRSWICSNQGEVHNARAWAEEALKFARAHRWADILPQALLGVAVAQRDQGEIIDAIRGLEEALGLCLDQNKRMGQAHCLQGLGVIARMRGELDKARRLIREAMALHDIIENPSGVALCHVRLAEVEARSHSLEQARVHLHAAETIYNAEGDRLGLARCSLMRADLARREGDLFLAERLYSEASDGLKALGSRLVAYARLGLGVVYCVDGVYKEAYKPLLSASEAFEEQGLRPDLWAALSVLLACAADRGQWPLWDNAFEQIEPLTLHAGLADIDIAEAMERAGRLSAHAGHLERTRRVLTLARHQWRRLGRDDRLASLDVILAKIGPARPG